MTIPKQIRFSASAPIIEGEAEKLEICLRVWRTSKRTGRITHHHVTLNVDRYFLTGFCQQIAKMQARDRERIGRELIRLKREIAPLTEEVPR